MKPEAIERRILAARALSETFRDVVPEELAWRDDGAMEVLWSDAHRSAYEPEYLRSICPCAECRGTHGTPKKAFHILSTAQLQGAARQTVVDGVAPVGRYALAFTWGDGHSDGIYSWAYLRAMSPDIED